ncbi:MAG: ECF-type sigma factor, partial [Pseudomonadota bacterium]
MSGEIKRITQLLQQGRAGDSDSMNHAMKLLYDDLSRMASKHLRQRYGNRLDGATLEPAALVNETYFKIIKQRASFDNRAHFFAVATRLMLRVLADYER